MVEPIGDPPGRRSIVLKRLAAVRGLVADRGASGALLMRRSNVAWATLGAEAHVVLSSEGAVAAVLVTADEAVVLTQVNEAARIAEEELRGLDLEVVGLPWHDPNAIPAEARRRAGGEPFDDAALEDLLLPLRMRLSEPEAERVAWLAGRARDAVTDALDGAARGRTEHEVSAEAARLLGVDGVRAPVLLAAADDRIARYRHPIPTARPIERRLMLVVVAERWGLHAAITRFAELSEPEAEIVARTEAVGRVHEAMTVATRPGASLGDVMDAAQRAYAAEGHPEEWRLHHQGGVIGYAGRERIAVPGDETAIEPGMAFAWNPSIAGAKAEETILLREDGVRVLTR
jgi:Xaa-Pro dipeptidase